MKTFHCDNCGSLLFFDNVQCIQCGHYLGFLPDVLTLTSLEASGDGVWRSQAPSANGRLYRNCANCLQHRVCNWLVSTNDPSPHCVSCRLNTVIPNLAAPGNSERWLKLEKAKRRVLYTVLSLGLPTEGNSAENRPPLRFRFLADEPGANPILTGHDNGVITVNIAEADDDEREHRRVGLHEPYRTLVGHFRHEIAHYYWDRLIANTARLPNFRQIFGDESQDYRASLNAYYQQGPPVDWQKRYVSAYASSHPWEDWAETWAHYFHMVDTLETASTFGLTLRSNRHNQAVINSDPSKVANHDAPFDQIVENWLPLTAALNSLNRGMGLPDLYPFVLLDRTIEKMRFVHETIQAPIIVLKDVASPPAPPVPANTSVMAAA